jgi:hypothetical protein
MEFPQSAASSATAAAKDAEADGLRSVLVRVYSSHVHENREENARQKCANKII